MSEQNEPGGESTPDPKIEAEAKAMGWVPKDQFKGPEEKWSDAATFVKRGEEIVPILRANNKKLVAQMDQVSAENRRLAALVASSNEAISDLRKYQDETTRAAVEKERGKLLKDLKQAKKDDDVDLEVDIEEQLKKVDKALDAKSKEEAKPKDPNSDAVKVDPAFTAWVNDPENEWFTKDARKQSLAVTIARELRASGSELEGKAFFDKVGEEVTAYLGSKVAAAPSADKVNGGKGGGGGGNGSGGKSYKDLPAEAKKACDKYANTLVGTGRAYKDAASWQAQYAKDYFAQE